MARGQTQTAELSDFEKQRQANIAERDALLKKLTQEAQQAGLYTKPPSKRTSGGTSRPQKKKTPAKRVKQEEDIQPRRTSSRLAGITADSEVAKRKADQEYEAVQEAARTKRMRVSGDLAIGDIVVAGKGWDKNANGFLSGDVLARGAKPYERTFGEDEITETTDKELKALREKMSGLELWDGWEPGRIKITPERIYSMAFHPTAAKPLVFAGDKLGNLGLIDCSQKGPQVKTEEHEDEDEKKPPKPRRIDTNPGDTDPEDSDEDAEDDPDPQITTIKPHTRTISAMHTHPSAPQTLYTASYDSSIRALDLEKSVAVETYAPQSSSDDEPLSGIDMAAADPNVLYFTTLNGLLGRHDARLAPIDTDLYQLSEKKIGGFSLHPLAPHYLVTASLDRFMRLWDLRKIAKKLPTLVGEHESRLSVSHAAFNTAGQVATSSYDDSIKIYDFHATSSLAPGSTLTDEEMKPATVVRHNCQTGRWVTILRPQWQRHPQDGIQKFCIGNMNRFVDVYGADGTQLAQLGGDGITAVPAVAQLHPSMEWVAAGTASGKLCLWM